MNKIEEIKINLFKELENIEYNIKRKFWNCVKLKEIEKISEMIDSIYKKSKTTTKDRKEIIKIFVELDKIIFSLERLLEFSEYYEWTWFVYLKTLRNLIYDLYEEIFPEDDKEYSILDFIIEIINNWMKYFDFNSLDEKEKEKYKFEDWYLYTNELIENNKDKFIKFKNLDEIIQFIEDRKIFNF